MKKIKKLWPVLFVIPYICGVYGYISAGHRVTDALYGSIGFYTRSRDLPSMNIWIEIARWTALPIAVVTILYTLQKLWRRIISFLKSFARDSVAIYTDTYDLKEVCFNKKAKVVFPGEQFSPRFKTQIMLFKSDEKNLAFYENHKAELKGKDVYIGLCEIEMGLLKELENASVFDVNGTIARMLWKKIALWNNDKQDLDVVIYGSGALSQDILSFGLQLNLFSKNQHITYHYITSNPLFELRHKNMDLMNGDNIIYYNELNENTCRVVAASDYIIVGEQCSPELLQTLMTVGKKAQLYFYAPSGEDAGRCMTVGKGIIPFGEDEKVFTDDNIRKKALIQNAIKLNEEYARKYSDNYQEGKEWDKLSGFLKSSNISSADYHEVLLVLHNKGVPKRELAQLEHQRWCRFHLLNYWTLPENVDDLQPGQSKDSEKRIHKDLVPFDDLSEEEKDKDTMMILCDM